MTKTKTKIKLSKQTRKLCVRRAPLCVAGIQLGWCAIARAQVSDVEGIYKLASKNEEKREPFSLFLFYYIFFSVRFLHFGIDKFGVFARQHYISAPAPPPRLLFRWRRSMFLVLSSAFFDELRLVIRKWFRSTLFLNAVSRKHLKREFRIYIIFFIWISKKHFVYNISSGQSWRFFRSPHKLIFIVIGIFMAYFVRFIKTIASTTTQIHNRPSIAPAVCALISTCETGAIYKPKDSIMMS